MSEPRQAKVLSAPLRVSWGLAPESKGGLTRDVAAGLAGELAALKVFFVTLRLAGGSRHDIGGIVAALKKKGVRVTLSLADAGSIPDADALAGADAADISPAHEKALGDIMKALPGPAKNISVSIVPGKAILPGLEGIIRLAVGSGIKAFHLINPDITSTAEADEFVLGDKERNLFKETLERILKPLGREAKVSVHDLFLHRCLKLPGLGARVEYSGCQAGDALAFIDGRGVAYPCASFPLPLGDIKEKSFKEIWDTATRRELRESISRMPSECAPCPDAKDCLGACRGIAWRCRGFESKDPNCGR